jgi:hypothetical protein
MGTWESEPWANDSAADWFGDLMDATSLRDEWFAGITADPENEFEVVRAAAWLFIQLGRTYVWPVDDFDDDLERTITALQVVRGTEEVAEDVEFVEMITQEIEELQSRRSS